MSELTFGGAQLGEPALAELRALAGTAGDARLDRLERHLAQPRYRPELTVMAHEAGRLVGYALVVHRRARLGAAVLDAGLLEDVSLPPGAGIELQHQLVGGVMGMLYEQGLALALVRAPAERYAPLGFAPFLLRSRLTLGDRRDPQPSAALAPASPADAEDMAALYEASNAALPLAELRSSADWRALLAAERPLTLRDRGGSAVAYARLGDGPAVVEAGAADSGAARALLGALGARAWPGGALELALPAGHPVARAGLLLGGELCVTAAPSATDERAPLAGIVDLPGALTALAAELDRRLAASRYAGWDGALRIELDAGRATLAIAAGRVTVVDGTRPADVRLRRVTLPALAQLLLGYRDAADLRAEGGLDCDDIALGLVDALFPATGASDDAARS